METETKKEIKDKKMYCIWKFYVENHWDKKRRKYTKMFEMLRGQKILRFI